MTFRIRIFLTSLLAAAVTLLVATTLVSWSIRGRLEQQIRTGIINEARLAAETMAHRQAGTAAELDAEADAIGRLVSARVTFLARDGSVVGDSELSLESIRTVDNHATRPEVQQAQREGLGIAIRYSNTLHIDMLYVAVVVAAPATSDVAAVRLALPLTAVRDQLAQVRQISLLALGAGLVAALVLSWVASALLSRRLSTIAAVARRYGAGDFAQPSRDYGTDEIGTVARALDDSVREIGRRVTELDADRTRMEAILSGMIEGVLVVSEGGHLQLVNAAARRMLRLEDPPEGRHYLDVVRRPDVASQIGAALQGSVTERLDLTLPSEPDTLFIARSAPVISAGTRGAVLVLHDVTDLRRADRIRRDFVANVSHELRTPLTAVRGYVEALLDGDVDQVSARRFLETIDRHTLRMERLVRDLLRLARLDAGQEPLERVPCTVESLFTGVTAELSSAIEGRGQLVVQEIGDGAHTISGDPAKLHDALRNLLENATNYAPERSTIVMGASRQDGRIALTVADSGPGIPEADLPRVFERFYRVDKARSRGARDPGGTGLGLAIVKHLIELHGGTVRVVNRREGGALFTIEVPA
jgi:two-component system phosphate regulon sensor histidine kinase PhoR